MGRTRAVVAGAVALAVAGAAVAIPLAFGDNLPDPLPELPVLHEATARGTGIVAPAADRRPAGKTVDGATSDWKGVATGFGGMWVRSRGELIYTDHIFDAYGADDGADAERLARFEAVNGPVPEGYRVEPVFAYDVPGELGVPVEVASADEHYGNAGRIDAADLREARIAATRSTLNVLGRFTSMSDDAPAAAVLVLLDTRDGPAAPVEIPFGAGLTSAVADVAVLLSSGRGEAVDLATGATAPVAVAVRPTGYENAIEASIRAASLGLAPGWGDATVRVALATGVRDPDTGDLADLDTGSADGEPSPNVANVAFRTEPVTTWFDQRQALALHRGTIDEFFVDVEPQRLAAGVTETWRPGPGYHDRIFASAPAISTEGGTEGIHQHYGVYVPSSYDPAARTPMTMWLHWRGGKAHSAATVSPRIMRDMGEAVGGLVVAPRGRGTSTWYLGRGQADIDEVWADVHDRFTIDDDRVYVSGHSMGGWGSYLLTILHPDRFAAALPVAGPVTQGAWTGADFDGCDEMKYDEYTPCYIETNQSDPRLQHTRRLLGNLRNTPIGVFHGAIDELVPVSGVTRQVEELVRLGYRHRYYLFPTYEHYSHPVVDEWAEGVRYMHGHTRDANPARVTYVRDMPFERSVETGPSRVNPTRGLSFDFDHAYWMSELTPVDPLDGVARFDGLTRGRAAEPDLRVPEAGGPASLGQAGPYSMTGIGWARNPLTPLAPLANAFDIELAGARAVRLDLARMGLTTTSLSGSVLTEHPLDLRLAASWTRTAARRVRIDGVPAATRLVDGALAVAVPAGAHRITVG